MFFRSPESLCFRNALVVAPLAKSSGITVVQVHCIPKALTVQVLGFRTLTLGTCNFGVSVAGQCSSVTHFTRRLLVSLVVSACVCADVLFHLLLASTTGPCSQRGFCMFHGPKLHKYHAQLPPPLNEFYIA